VISQERKVSWDIIMRTPFGLRADDLRIGLRRRPTPPWYTGKIAL